MTSLPPLAERAELADPTGDAPSALVRVLLAAFAAGIAANDLVVWALGTVSASVIASVIAGGPLLLASVWQVIRTGRVHAPSPALLCLTALGAWALLGIAWARDLQALRASLTTLVQGSSCNLFVLTKRGPPAGGGGLTDRRPARQPLAGRWPSRGASRIAP